MGRTWDIIMVLYSQTRILDVYLNIQIRSCTCILTIIILDLSLQLSLLTSLPSYTITITTTPGRNLYQRIHPSTAHSNITHHKHTHKTKQVAEIYENSPALQNFPENNEKYNYMTKYELANLALSIMSLAGMVGPKTFAMITLGKTKLPKYVGKETHKINVCDIWDTLDLTNREEVKKYAHECGRLRNPVSNTHKIAQEDFTVDIGGVDRTFPKGTIIYIPMLLAGLDKDMWGGGQEGERSAFEFDHGRENLCPFSMIFHSVGDETNGRICPGRKVAETLIVDMLIALGKERQKEGMVE